ncbi:MAG: hypothetical protein R3B84_24420 [Zavarzinella sp.]
MKKPCLIRRDSYLQGNAPHFWIANAQTQPCVPERMVGYQLA